MYKELNVNHFLYTESMRVSRDKSKNIYEAILKKL